MPDGSTILARPLFDSDREWVGRYIVEKWGGGLIVVHGTIYSPAGLSGFVVELDGEPVGLVTFVVVRNECEIVTLNSDLERRGIGTVLIDSVIGHARMLDCRRVWAMTTNDNLDALRFYQKRGFVLARLHGNAVERSRTLKPGIPLTGRFGIPIRDEIELELDLERDTM